MSPRWLHWPVAATPPAVKYSIAGTLAAGSTGSTGTRRNLTVASESGDDAATLAPLASGDFMVNQTIKIDLSFSVSGMSGFDYATQVSNGSPTATLTANGVSMDVNLIGIVPGEAFIKFELRGADAESVWFANNCAVGNSFEFTLNY
jgi:hypothetical protein